MSDSKKSSDENDDLKNGRASKDPKDGTAPIPIVDGKRVPAPTVLTVKELMEESAARAMGEARQEFCTTGIHRLDDATGGLRPGHVWVFGADTSWGKSSFLVMIADDNIKKGKRVLIVSAEDAPTMYGDRLVVRRSMVRAKQYRDRSLSFEEKRRVQDMVRAAESVPVYLDARGKRAEWVAAEVKIAVAKHGIDLVAYDYLQEFRSSKNHQDRRNEVAEVAAALRESIKTTGVTGIIFSQITVSEGKKHPDKHSIRESRDVSNAAEAVLLGFIPEKPIIAKKDKREVAKAGQKCILIDKAKDGLRGVVALKWDNDSACFISEPKPPGPYDEFDNFASDYEG